MKFFRQRSRAFGYAIEGLWKALVQETNLKLHVLAATVVVSASLFFEVNRTETVLLWLCIGMVIALELLNTAIERLCDKLSPQQSPEVKYIKDVSAAAVLVASVAAVICGTLIFWPYLFG